ncbi:FadR/GntR family transcriptional regulator [Bacillus sp. FJAT-44742]|uniref:FadR/GntR family transcriptional regulator n=1 Tax=Bacillus sp. FJAT-44742 TaxID=2014005 RepID=UPI0018E220A5|nr:FadR/GntR family transcriptional regulator [Bacillus sp. FJAT-44742]
MKPVFTDKKSISEKVADYIKGQIREGRFLPGDKISGERDMAKELNVSRNTIREAYKILEAYGYLKSIHGKGVFIAQESEQIKKMTDAFFVTNSQLKDLFAVRKMIEEQLVEWAIINGSDAQIEQLATILEKANNNIKENHMREKLIDYDLEFHLLIATMAQNEVALQIMHNLIDLLSKARIQSFMIPNRPEQSVEEHINILNAIKAKDVALAKHYMNAHLESVQKTLIDK